MTKTRGADLEMPIQDTLACPNCGAALNFESYERTTCMDCLAFYPRASTGILDLRLRSPKLYPYQFCVGTDLLPKEGFAFGTLPLCAQPLVDFSGIDVPFHLSKELMSHFPKAATATSIALDLGCGTALHRRVCEHAGFKYLGIDYNSDDATVLGDAHALPFKRDSFELILSIAVLEHIRFPFVFMKEAHRVLMPGGTLIGSVAFLEPFHGDSYYHHTHLGTYNSLSEGGFDIVYVSPNQAWPGLVAQANMGLFPRLPRWISRTLIAPILWLHRAWWGLGRRLGAGGPESERICRTTGAFYFVARKGTAA